MVVIYTTDCALKILQYTKLYKSNYFPSNDSSFTLFNPPTHLNTAKDKKNSICFTGISESPVRDYG